VAWWLSCWVVSEVRDATQARDGGGDAFVAVPVFEKLGGGILPPRMVQPRSDLGGHAGRDPR
jgi:hypothetical protein